jgi:low temperature requirement protein LtrA
MCFTVLLSRAWLALQYLVTTIMCTTRKHRSQHLTLPLAANSLLFLCVAAVFGGLFAGFRNVRKELTGVLIGVYVVLTIEFFGTLTISMFWRKLSFKATHVGERLGLLGLIIIGEGVIGLSKTIVRTMGKNGPTIGSSAQVFCIILILVFMWYVLDNCSSVNDFADITQGSCISTKSLDIASVPSSNKCGWRSIFPFT